MQPVRYVTGLLLGIIACKGLAAESGPLRVKIDSGVLEGISTGPLFAFMGVPYAASPAGASRWTPPRPMAPWAGVRSARELGPVCPQPDRDSVNFRRLTMALGGDPAWVPSLGATSEDCLSLNVFTTGLGRTKPRPVMVWLHGGSNRTGSGNEEAAALAPYGVVVVTLNYRLGLLGFLAHPALHEESPHASSGNYGLLDQIAALAWVQRNIAAFGGDPRRVTIFGHSAGADSVSQLLASPLARGLFQRAVIQSGGLGTSRPRAEMEAEGSRIASQLAVPPDNPLPVLRALPVDRLLAASNGPFDATADGWVVPVPGPGALAPGQDGSVHLLVGATTNEASIFALPQGLDAYQAMVGETGPAWKERVTARYPATNAEQAQVAMVRLMTDRDFRCPARYVASRRSGPTWLYSFSTLPTPSPAGARMGAFHGADVRLLFDRTYGVPQGELGQQVGAAMRRYWARFAETGDPNGPGLANWPRYETKNARSLELGDPIHAVTAELEACAVFDGLWDDQYRKGQPSAPEVEVSR